MRKTLREAQKLNYKFKTLTNSKNYESNQKRSLQSGKSRSPMRNNLIFENKKPNFEREKVSMPNAIIDLKVNSNYSHRL